MNNLNKQLRKSKSLNIQKELDDLYQSQLVLVPSTLVDSGKSNINEKLATASSNLFTCSQPNTMYNKSSKSQKIRAISYELSSFLCRTRFK